MSSSAGSRFFHGPRELKRAAMSSTVIGVRLAANTSATARTCATGSFGHGAGLRAGAAATAGASSAASSSWAVSISAWAGARCAAGFWNWGRSHSTSPRASAAARSAFSATSRSSTASSKARLASSRVWPSAGASLPCATRNAGSRSAQP